MHIGRSGYVLGILHGITIRHVLANVIALMTVGAMCFFMAKQLGNEKRYYVSIPVEFVVLAIVAIGSGLIQLLSGHNPVIELIGDLLAICRQHRWVVVALISLFLLSGLTVERRDSESPREPGNGTEGHSSNRIQLKT